jgi:hypothetical protein
VSTPSTGVTGRALLAVLVALLAATAPVGAGFAVAVSPATGPTATSTSAAQAPPTTGDGDTLPSATVADSTPPSVTEEEGDGTADPLVFEYTFARLPDRPGEVRVTVTVTAPTTVTEVGVQPTANATLVSAEGFESVTAEGDREFRWERGDEGSATASLTYDTSVNRTDDGTVEAVDTGEWALFNWQSTDRWRYAREAGTERPPTVERATVAGEGVAGAAYAYLGPHESYTRRVAGEELRLVVPAAAEMAVEPTTVADALARAARDLRVGGRHAHLNVFVAPDPVEASGRLSRTELDGTQDMFVGADERLDTPDNAWFHEYVHSRQAYETGPAVDWLDDGLAEYYAALLTHEQGRISERAFYDYVRTERYADSVLAETESVTDPASYFKGMRVLAALDARLRAASDGDRTLEDVFRAVNDHPGTVTLATLTDIATTDDGPDATWVERHVTTSAAPSVPDFLPDDRTTSAVDGEVGDVVDAAVAAPPVSQVLFAAGLACGVGTLLFRRRRS